MTINQRKAEAYQDGNQACAQIIAGDPERYPGVMQEWAAMVLAKAAERTEPAAGRAA